jgi:hypothetical protein
VSRALMAAVMLAALGGCVTSPPDNVDNLCAIFRDKDSWYGEAAEARDEWGSPIAVMMAIMHQESRFVGRAKPPRRKILGFIPGPRPSDSYGYSQALKSTWKSYQRDAGRYGADRNDFGDAIDFIGWYNYHSWKRSGISRADAYHLYLAYHEGHGGYNRGSYRSKAWLRQVAGKVDRRARLYAGQLASCEEELQEEGWFFGWF